MSDAAVNVICGTVIAVVALGVFAYGLYLISRD